MNEGFSNKKFVSKEQDYLIDPESDYFKALAFSGDPIAYFREYIKGLEADSFRDEDICQ